MLKAKRNKPAKAAAEPDDAQAELRRRAAPVSNGLQLPLVVVDEGGPGAPAVPAAAAATAGPMVAPMAGGDDQQLLRSAAATASAAAVGSIILRGTTPQAAAATSSRWDGAATAAGPAERTTVELRREGLATTPSARRTRDQAASSAAVVATSRPRGAARAAAATGPPSGGAEAGRAGGAVGPLPSTIQPAGDRESPPASILHSASLQHAAAAPAVPSAAVAAVPTTTGGGAATSFPQSIAAWGAPYPRGNDHDASLTAAALSVVARAAAPPALAQLPAAQYDHHSSSTGNLAPQQPSAQAPARARPHHDSMPLQAAAVFPDDSAAGTAAPRRADATAADPTRRGDAEGGGMEVLLNINVESTVPGALGDMDRVMALLWAAGFRARTVVPMRLPTS